MAMLIYVRVMLRVDYSDPIEPVLMPYVAMQVRNIHAAAMQILSGNF